MLPPVHISPPLPTEHPLPLLPESIAMLLPVHVPPPPPTEHPLPLLPESIAMMLPVHILLLRQGQMLTSARGAGGVAPGAGPRRGEQGLRLRYGTTTCAIRILDLHGL